MRQRNVGEKMIQALMKDKRNATLFYLKVKNGDLLMPNQARSFIKEMLGRDVRDSRLILLYNKGALSGYKYGNKTWIEVSSILNAVQQGLI